MNSVRWAKMSREDIARIDHHYRQIDPALADQINERIVRATGFLEDPPRPAPATPRGDRRKWRVAHTPYVLFYRVAADHVRILRVLHSAQEITGRQ